MTAYAELWRWVFITAHERPLRHCAGCGYFAVVHDGGHRADCTGRAIRAERRRIIAERLAELDRSEQTTNEGTPEMTTTPDPELGACLIRAMDAVNAMDDVKAVGPDQPPKPLREWTAADVTAGFPFSLGVHVAEAMRVHGLARLGDELDDDRKPGVGYSFMCGD